jgi:ATP-dependent Clp protease ATP-binding subunit ClpX
MFEVPSRQSVERVIVTKESVAGTESPVILTADDIEELSA